MTTYISDSERKAFKDKIRLKFPSVGADVIADLVEAVAAKVDGDGGDITAAVKSAVDDYLGQELGDLIAAGFEDLIDDLDYSFVSYVEYVSPESPSDNKILDSTVLDETNPTVIEDAIGQPDVPRMLEVTITGATIVGDLVIVGKDINDEDLTVNVDLNGDGSRAIGVFKSVESITLPARGTAGDAVKIGTTGILGLPVLPGDTVFMVLEDGNQADMSKVTVFYSNLVEHNGFSSENLPNGSISYRAYFYL